LFPARSRHAITVAGLGIDSESRNDLVYGRAGHIRQAEVAAGKRYVSFSRSRVIRVSRVA
jgi:hypothetical protein